MQLHVPHAHDNSPYSLPFPSDACGHDSVPATAGYRGSGDAPGVDDPGRGVWLHGSLGLDTQLRHHGPSHHERRLLRGLLVRGINRNLTNTCTIKHCCETSVIISKLPILNVEYLH